MARNCDKCGKVDGYHYYKDMHLCSDCYDEVRLQETLEKSKDVKRIDDFKEWDHGDLSDLFWHHLGEYQKDKDKKEHFPMMKRALYWVFHDSHGLSSSFTHALKWANIELSEVLGYKESNP